MSGRENVDGTIYLIHLDQPMKHARHYLGFAIDLDARIETHRRGIAESCSFMRAVHKAKITWSVVRTWKGSRDLEKKLKCRRPRKDGSRTRGGSMTRHCPLCRERVRAVARDYMRRRRAAAAEVLSGL